MWYSFQLCCLKTKLTDKKKNYILTEEQGIRRNKKEAIKKTENKRKIKIMSGRFLSTIHLSG